MAPPWILVDVSYLAYRAYHSTGMLAYEGRSTGVLYGVLRDLLIFHKNYGTEKFAFCFDGGKLKRQDLYPPYKHKNESFPTTCSAGCVWNEVNGDLFEQCEDCRLEDEEKENSRHEVHKQINQLRKEVLPNFGYANIYRQVGYEADDLLASLVQHSLPEGDKCLLVSADKDLYQLLSDNVSILNPRGQNGATTFTREDFVGKYGITPDLWPRVKALAGCTSDNVVGVPRVGEKTAIRYVKEELPVKTKAYQSIQECEGIEERNLKLVTLPFSGCPQYPALREELFDKMKWRKVLESLSMRSLIGRYL